MPTTREGSTADVVARLTRRFAQYFEAASGRPRNVLSLVRYFVHIRHQLADAVNHLRAANEDVQDRLMHQAEVAFLTRPERFATVSGRAELIRAWTTLLVEANEKLEADERKAEAHAKGPRVSADDDSAVMAASRAQLASPHDDQ